VRRRAAACAGLAALLLSFAAASEEPQPRFPAGAEAFQASCSVCHGAKGAGNPALAPPLTRYPAAYAASPAGRRQLAITVLNGMFGGIDVDSKHFDFKMPDFAGQLDDATLAEVLNFVIYDIAHAGEGTQPFTAAEIAAERSRPVDGAAVRAERARLLSTLGL
jgi:mono/diheme cytochrome c family protein